MVRPHQSAEWTHSDGERGLQESRKREQTGQESIWTWPVSLDGLYFSQMISFTIPGDPIAKARPKAVSFGGHARVYTPARSKEFEYLVKLAAQEAMSGRAPLDEPVDVRIAYWLSIPKSFSMKKQRVALSGLLWPTGKPDLDNLVKATLDGMLKVVFRDDSLVCRLEISKHYAERPSTAVSVFPMIARMLTPHLEYLEKLTSSSNPF